MFFKSFFSKHGLHLDLFLFFFACFLLFANGHFGGDGLENYLTAESIVLDKDISIHTRAFDVKEVRYEVRGPGDQEGRHYANSGLGMPLLLTPFYLVGHVISKFAAFVPAGYITQFTVSFFNPFVTALIALILFVFLSELGFSRANSFYTVVCFAFCTMVLAYTRSGFSEPAVTLLVLAACLFLFRSSVKFPLKNIFFAACCIGFTLLIKNNSYLNFLLFFIILIRFSADIKNKVLLWKVWSVAVSAIVIFAAVYFLTKEFCGMTLKDNVTELASKGLTPGNRFFKGLYYYLLSPGKSLVLYNIPLILAALSFRNFAKRNRPVFFMIACVVLGHLLFYSFKFVRGSLFSWGPRYLYTLVPFVSIFLAQYLEDAGQKKGRHFIFRIVCVLSFLVYFPVLIVNISSYLFFIRDGLKLPEYLVNFVPELSPLCGNWIILLSAFNKLFLGASLNFSYNPDFCFISPIIQSLQGFDMPDVWWFNVIRIVPKLLPVVILSVAILLFLMVTTFIKIKKLILAGEQA
ncbi:MAG: hypothetical protein HQL28_01645 [Candidatus Omnitrophica bacterium]|nr:hypothetical protein [Candidatus Omnitrophota bacterium]